jgi:hypothetical protein
VNWRGAGVIGIGGVLLASGLALAAGGGRPEAMPMQRHHGSSGAFRQALDLSPLAIPSMAPPTFSDRHPPSGSTADALLLAAAGLPPVPAGDAYDLSLGFSPKEAGPVRLMHVWLYPVNVRTGAPIGWSLSRSLAVRNRAYGVMRMVTANTVVGVLDPTYLNDHPVAIGHFSVAIAYTVGAHPENGFNAWYRTQAAQAPESPVPACGGADTMRPVAIPRSDPFTFADQHQPMGATGTDVPVMAQGLPRLSAGQAYDVATGFSFNAQGTVDVMRLWLYPVVIDTGSPTGWAALLSMPVNPGQSGTAAITNRNLDPSNSFGDNPPAPTCRFRLVIRYQVGAHPANGFNAWWAMHPRP